MYTYIQSNIFSSIAKAYKCIPSLVSSGCNTKENSWAGLWWPWWCWRVVVVWQSRHPVQLWVMTSPRHQGDTWVVTTISSCTCITRSPTWGSSPWSSQTPSSSGERCYYCYWSTRSLPSQTSASWPSSPTSASSPEHSLLLLHLYYCTVDWTHISLSPCQLTICYNMSNVNTAHMLTGVSMMSTTVPVLSRTESWSRKQLKQKYFGCHVFLSNYQVMCIILA